MLTAADDYLIHQTPYTFDTVFTSDRNFYDRYFFNGYPRDGNSISRSRLGRTQTWESWMGPSAWYETASNGR